MRCDQLIFREGNLAYKDRLIQLRRPIDAEFYVIDMSQGTLTVLDANRYGIDRFQIIGCHITEVIARDVLTNVNYRLRDITTGGYQNQNSIPKGFYQSAYNSTLELRNKIALGYLLCYLKPQESFCITQEFLEDLDNHGLHNIVIQEDYLCRAYLVKNNNVSNQFSSIRPLELPPRPSVNAFLSVWLANKGGEIRVNRKIFAKDPSLAQKRVVVVEDETDENYVKLVLKDK